MTTRAPFCFVCLAFCAAISGCSGRPGCEEWGTREVVDYNFCNHDLAEDQVSAAQMPGAGRCVSPGTQERIYCVKRPRVEGQPVSY
jgi:hypothetical protein